MSSLLNGSRDSVFALETYTGRSFNVSAPSVSDICSEDIIHALANIGRYNGHCKRFYSVAEHSIYCHDEAKRRGFSPMICLVCLLHDGAEAYVNDIVTSTKNISLMEGYKELEDHIEKTIYLRFKDEIGCVVTKTLLCEDLCCVKQIDRAVLAAEVLKLMHSRGRGWRGLTEVTPAHISWWKWLWYGLPGRAEAGFRKRMKYYNCYY